MGASSARRVPIWPTSLVEQKGMNMPTLEKGQVYLYQLAKGDTFYTLENDVDKTRRGKLRRDFCVIEIEDDGETYYISEIDGDKYIGKEFTLNNLEVVYSN